MKFFSPMLPGVYHYCYNCSGFRKGPRVEDTQLHQKMLLDGPLSAHSRVRWIDKVKQMGITPLVITKGLHGYTTLQYHHIRNGDVRAIQTVLGRPFDIVVVDKKVTQTAQGVNFLNYLDKPVVVWHRKVGCVAETTMK